MVKKSVMMLLVVCAIAVAYFVFAGEGDTLQEAYAITETVVALHEDERVELIRPVAEQITLVERVAPAELSTHSLIIAPTVAVPIPAYLKTLAVVQPRGDVTSTGVGFNIFGSSDPDEALYMNGQTVINRVPEGFFNIFVDLSLGENVFVFSQQGQADVVRIIYREAVQARPNHQVMEKPMLVYAAPEKHEYVRVGDTIAFEVHAPMGASVKVEFGGETLTLMPEHIVQTDGTGQIYATLFRVEHIIPDELDGVGIIDLGRPLYVMEFNGQNMTKSGGIVRLIGTDTPFYATVVADAVWAFGGATLQGGPDWSLTRGQRALVRRISGDWVKLETGKWVQREGVRLDTLGELIQNTLSSGRYVRGESIDSIIWNASHNQASRVDFDGRTLRIYFALQEDVPEIDLSGVERENLFFSYKERGILDGVPFYAFTIHNDVNVEGFYTSYSDGELALNIRRRRSLATGKLPLYGFTFVIDAGHGGHDFGALGATGTTFSEKDINLMNAKNLAGRLEDLGAIVVLTRSTDVFLTLQERTDISRMIKPDMFISIHADSTVETTDASNIHGATFWYRNPNSRPLAEHFANQLHYINPMTTRRMQANRANFFVCRPTWTPSVIIEASFMNNINDFAWLLDPENRDALADGITRTILSYYY